jgi:hypothetical protein
MLRKIMQGGPTTCDGVPTVKVQVNIGPFMVRPHYEGYATCCIELNFDNRHIKLHDLDIPLYNSIGADIKTAIRRDADKWTVKSTSFESIFEWSPLIYQDGHRTLVNPEPALEFLFNVPTPSRPQSIAVATQVGKKFLQYIATALEKIGKKYGLHVRDGPVEELSNFPLVGPYLGKKVTFHLCEGGKLVQASRALHGLR